MSELSYSFNITFPHFLIQNIEQKVNPNIVVVEIDDEMVWMAGSPIDRSYYTKFLKKLQTLDIIPHVIGIDSILERRTDDDIGLRREFQEFRRTHYTSIVLPAVIDNENKLIPPHENFRDVVTYGFADPNIDKNTGRVTSFSLQRNVRPGDFTLDAFPLQILRQYFWLWRDNSYGFVDGTNTYHFFGNKIPLYPITNQKYSFFWSTQPKTYVLPYHSIDAADFQTVSFQDILNLPDNIESPQVQFFKQKLHEKILLIGYTDQESKDTFLVAGKTQPQHGIYIHANIINNILNGSYIVFFNRIIEDSILCLLILVIVSLNTLYSRFWSMTKILTFIGLMFFVLMLVYGVSFFSIASLHHIYYIPSRPFEFISIFVCGIIIIIFSKYLTEDQNKHILSRALSSYVSEDVANEILHQAGSVNLAGELKPITIFFSDIAWFTSLAEDLTPEELVAFLRIYLGKMSDIIISKEGFVNKYEWDAIMALWWAFQYHEDQWAYSACYATVLQEAALQEINAMLKKNNKPPISIRMGLHVGEAILGNIGSPGKKMEYTALWDNVNLASRLENINRYYKTSICVSGDIYQRVKDEFIFRYLDKIRVKGKNKSVDIYELITGNGPSAWMTSSQIEQFDVAIGYYQKRDFKTAYQLFHTLAKAGDYPSEIYKKRCKDFIKKAPPKKWDMVWNMDSK